MCDFSQYIIRRYKNDCDDVNRTNFTHMGLSIRTPQYRFTRWYEWNGPELQPHWSHPIGDELYDHSGDDGLDFDAGCVVADEATICLKNVTFFGRARQG